MKTVCYNRYQVWHSLLYRWDTSHPSALVAHTLRETDYQCQGPATWDPYTYLYGAPSGARTQDPRIKSPMLYQLS